MSRTLYPNKITIETLPELFAHHRARFGGMQMNANGGGDGTGTGNEGGQPQNDDHANQGPQRPDGVSEDEWNALGDPGRAAIVREREARQAAERALAATRARPTPPKKDEQPKPEQKATEPAGGEDGENDIATIVQKAVQAAIKPFQEAEEQRTAEQAAQRIQDSVMEAADKLFHDPTDALAQVNLADLTDGSGNADQAKINTALDDLLKRKPHLGKVPDGRRYATPGSGAGAGGGSAAPLDARVQETLKRMQSSAGIKPAS